MDLPPSCMEQVMVVATAKRRALLAAAMLMVKVLRFHRQRKQKKRRVWARLQRKQEPQDVLSLLFNEQAPEDPKLFSNYIKVAETILDELLAEVIPFIHKKDTVMREAIPARDRLAATLRYLVTGHSYQDLPHFTRIVPNTLANLIPETLRAIVTVLEEKAVIKCPSSSEEWEKITQEYNLIHQFPHCIGAVDAKLIQFRPTRCDDSSFQNYKGQDNMILLGLVDATYKFLYIDAGKCGRLSETTLFQESYLAERLNTANLNLPAPCALQGGVDPLPYVIAAGDAFALKPNVMKPYPECGLDFRRTIFNYRLSRARSTAENAFGILANRFRILGTIIPLAMEKVELITRACCLLHNYLIEKQPQLYIPPGYKEGTGQSKLQSLTQQGGNQHSDSALTFRDLFADYFNTLGAEEWQKEPDAQDIYWEKFRKKVSGLETN